MSTGPQKVRLAGGARGAPGPEVLRVGSRVCSVLLWECEWECEWVCCECGWVFLGRRVGFGSKALSKRGEG